MRPAHPGPTDEAFVAMIRREGLRNLVLSELNLLDDLIRCGDVVIRHVNEEAARVEAVAGAVKLAGAVT